MTLFLSLLRSRLKYYKRFIFDGLMIPWLRDSKWRLIIRYPWILVKNRTWARFKTQESSVLLRVKEELQTKVGKIVSSFTKCKIKVHFNSSHHDILVGILLILYLQLDRFLYLYWVMTYAVMTDFCIYIKLQCRL